MRGQEMNIALNFFSHFLKFNWVNLDKPLLRTRNKLIYLDKSDTLDSAMVKSTSIDAASQTIPSPIPLVQRLTDEEAIEKIAVSSGESREEVARRVDAVRRRQPELMKHLAALQQQKQLNAG